MVGERVICTTEEIISLYNAQKRMLSGNMDISSSVKKDFDDFLKWKWKRK